MQIMDMIEDMSFLYNKKISGWPQITTPFCWLPGKHVGTEINTKSVLIDLMQKKQIGLTGRSFGNWKQPQSEQNYYQHWIAIDIDSGDNPELTPEKVASLLPEANIRTSRSGKGVHAYFKLAEPILVQRGHSLNISRILTPYRARLKANGINPCKANSLNFWVYGGKQQWVTRVSSSIVAKEVEEIPNKHLFSGDSWLLSSLDPMPQRFYLLLMEKGIIPKSPLIASKYQIVSRQIYQATKDTPFAFETCSTMQNNDFNGFLSCDGINVSIYICADGKIVNQFMCGFDAQKGDSLL